VTLRPTSREALASKKDTSNENSVKKYQFECAYCALKTDEYNPFMDHINTYHLESEDENDNDNKDLCLSIFGPMQS
jgi:hypothetical protein